MQEENTIDKVFPDDLLIVDLGEAMQPSIIKVIGVGGGGDNAVANMYREGIREVKIVACNTDQKALEDSPIPNRLQLGPGLGAGGNPEKGRYYAEKDIEKIRAELDDHTRMVFITAGMGGGTGTGASPVIAREAKAKGILTVGIVTIPFLFEMSHQIDKALTGVENLAKEVDAILIINNERLKDIYTDLSVLNAFKKADMTLTTAVRAIMEFITMHGVMNLDFCDVETILRDGGVAIISSGYGSGTHRIKKAIDAALNSPLLNDTDVFRAKRLAMCFTTPHDENKAVTIEEYQGEVSEFMRHFNPDVETKWGYMEADDMEEDVKVTILASGFSLYDQPEKEDTAEEDYDIDKVNRRSLFYGKEQGTGKQKRYNIFIYDTDDLENEALMELVDDVPTAVREHNKLKEMQQRTASKPTTPAEPKESVITPGQTFDMRG